MKRVSAEVLQFLSVRTFNVIQTVYLLDMDTAVKDLARLRKMGS